MIIIVTLLFSLTNEQQTKQTRRNVHIGSVCIFEDNFGNNAAETLYVADFTKHTEGVTHLLSAMLYMKDMAWTISANLHTAPTAPGLKYPEPLLHTAVSCNYNKDPVTACNNHSLGVGECSGVGPGGGGGGRRG